MFQLLLNGDKSNAQARVDAEEVERELESMSDMTPEMTVSLRLRTVCQDESLEVYITHHHGKAATTNWAFAFIAGLGDALVTVAET